MNIRSMLLGCMIVFLCAGHAFAKVETKQAADAFLAKYCIELVNTIEVQYEDQKDLASKEKWKEFFEKGVLIAGIADVYSKLCK